jgi:hypothetical protein
MTPDTVASQPTTNRFDRMEIAGAFGDLGTLIPFVVAYLASLKMDPFGVLFAFGVGILGLGFGFMIEGAKMMSQNWWIGGAAVAGPAPW